jgi:hypothetical protein
MAPTLRAGDQLAVWFFRRTPRPRAGEVVLVALPERPLSVKRVARVLSGGEVWVEGDNAAGSTDSRDLGPVPPEAVRGRVLARLWPRPRLVRPSTGQSPPTL